MRCKTDNTDIKSDMTETDDGLETGTITDNSFISDTTANDSPETDITPKAETFLQAYYADNARKLRAMADKIIARFGGLSDKDYHDFYSIANEVFTDILQKYDGKQCFDGFLYSCLSNKFKTEMTARNRRKRKVQLPDGQEDAIYFDEISLDAPLENDESLTVGELLSSDFDMETVLSEKNGAIWDEKTERYLNGLNNIQRQIVEMKMEGVPISEIKERLGLSEKRYHQYCEELKSFENIRILYSCDNHTEDKGNKETSLKMRTETQTMEKSKPDRLCIASIIKKIDKHTIRFDHPLQRESEQWSPSMKGNLISDILQGNPLPSLVFAEQIINGIAIIWDLDGKQRCTNAYAFAKDGYKITKNIRRWNIEYQVPVTDENGNPAFDENNFPIYEKRKFDIRGKKFSELPEELQEKFNDYNFEIVQYLNCTSEDIAYHIFRYNEGKPMSASQKGITLIGEKYAERVKAISNMPFFKDMGGYKVSEFRNGTINRVVVESVMTANYLKDWKKKQEDMCEYIKQNATPAVFDSFEEMVGRLEKVVTEEVSELFDSKDSFLWFGLFARFIKSETDDRKFTEFMAEFARSLHSKRLDGISFDDLNGKSTKDKNVVLDKMDHLEKLMYAFLEHRTEQTGNAGTTAKPETTVTSRTVPKPQTAAASGTAAKPQTAAASATVPKPQTAAVSGTVALKGTGLPAQSGGEFHEISISDFIRQNVSPDIMQEDIDFFGDCLKDFIHKLKKTTPLPDKRNLPSLMAIVAYACRNDIDMDDWFTDYLEKHSAYVKNQRENYLSMKRSLDLYSSAPQTCSVPQSVLI